MEQQLFIDILDKNKESIFRLCKAYTDSHEDAKDLFQEVLINVWKSLPSFQNRSAPGTWVYRIAVNVCLRAKEKDKRRKTIFGGDTAVKLEKVQISDAPKTQYQDLYTCIHRLNDTDKSLILLYLEDISYKEISAITGLTENNIAVKILRIKTKLFQCLKP